MDCFSREKFNFFRCHLEFIPENRNALDWPQSPAM